MRLSLSTRLSLLVGVLLAACDDCPRTVTEKEFPKQLTRDELCAVETDQKLAYSGQALSLGIQSDRCAALCGDSDINTCEIPYDKQDEFRAIYPDGLGGPADGGGAPTGPCPYAEKVGAISVTCKQLVRTGSYSNGCPVEGRRFEGYLEASTASGARDAQYAQYAHGSPAVGRYLASCAHLEAASVVAFDALAEELAFHGAPHDLVEACRAAAREEIEHAASIGALARDFGAEPAALVMPVSREPRALVDIAMENAVEGTVRELFGAAQAHWRAARASDASIRAVMLRIAEDESRHAELSSRIDAFLDTRLDAGSREKVRAAAAASRAQLRGELSGSGAEVDPDLVAIAGVPSRDAALKLFDALDREVWQPASLS